MGFGSSGDRRGVLRRLAGLGFGLAVPGTLRTATAATDAAAEPLALGIFPYLPALQIGRQFGPLASAFAGLCARPVSLRTKSTFPAFRQLLLDGHYDLALLHPFLFADAMAVQDYRPLGRLREDLAAIVVARHEQPIERFADLAGATLAVPPSLSAVAQLVQHELRREGLTGPDGVRLVFHRTKSACLHAVASNAAAACALPGFVLDQLELFEPIALEPKFATPAIPGVLLVAHGRLGDGHVAALREAVLGWDNAAAGVELLHALGWSGLVPVRPGEYDRTRLALLVEQ
jgi:ABC-type phosphate/phosphonate transport system substrate-binding protein